MGPSGSGKSTLAHCINGLVPFSFPGKTTGTLLVDGKVPSKTGIFGMSKSVGTVLQDTDGQFIGLTVAEDIAFALENDQVPLEEMQKRVLEAADAVDVENLLDQAPSDLSGGQKQRVSMGGVIVDDVSILLFDEPLANLDPATGKHAIRMIDQIKKNKDVTILIIEHRIEDVLYKDVDRIVVVNDGTIIADLKPETLLSDCILTDQGMREPLYIAALKYAGCDLSKMKGIQHVETLELEEQHKKAVQNWFEAVNRVLPERNTESMLSVEHLSFSYETGRKILNNIHFEIKKGDMISIVGKNGAGKSTLAGLICGFHEPTEGKIRLHGEDMSKMSIKERGEKIGLVMQSPNQMISKPMIYDEVALGLKVRGVPEAEIKERVFETLKVCGLYPFRNWPVSALSFGQKKRVSIASILVMNPEIMILDEPTAGQDYKHYTEIMEFLKELNEKRGITIIMITHDMHLMLEYTDRAIVIADGQMIADDVPSKILTDEEIADKAYLKKTSLYDLAVNCKIQNPSEFVDRFIYFERNKEAGDKNE